MHKLKPHLIPSLKSGLVYGAGLAIGNVIAVLIFSITSLEKFSPGNDVIRLVVGVLLAFVITGFGAGMGAFVGGKSLPVVDPPRGKWEYAWKSGLVMGFIYGLLLFPIALALTLFSFYNIGDIPVKLFMMLFAILGAVIGLLFGLAFGGWTVGIRRMWRVAGYAALGFALGGMALGMGMYVFIYSFNFGQYSLTGRIAVLFSLFVFGLTGGMAVALAYGRYAAEPYHADKPVFVWLTPLWRWAIGIGLVVAIFVFGVRPVLSLVRNTLQPQDAHLDTVLVSETVGTHWLDPVDLSSRFGLGKATEAQIDVMDDGQVGLVWIMADGVGYLPGVWDVAAKMVTWQEPLLIPTGNVAETPQIALDSQGVAHLAWAEAGEILYAPCNDTACAAPEVASSSLLACAAEANTHAAPAITVNGDDTLMLVWQTDVDALPMLQWSAGESPSTAVPTCVPLDDSLTAVRQPRVSAAEDGRFGLVFTAGIDADSRVYGTMLTTGWSEMVELGNGRYPEIYFDDNSGIHAIWCSAGGLAYWHDGEAIQALAVPCLNRPQMSIDSNGRLHVVWYSDEVKSVLGKVSSEFVLYEISQYDGGWTQPTIVDRVGNEFQPAMVVDKEGTLHMARTVGSLGEETLQYQAQVQYSCENYELSRLAQVLYDVTRLAQYRDPDSLVPYCQNRYDNLVYTPNADPDSYMTPIEPLENGAFDQMAQLASTARYEVLLATMWYDDDYAGESPGYVIASTVADLYNQVKANPENYPRGLTVRILLGNPPEVATGDFSGQLWHVLEDIRDAGVPEMVNRELGWNLQVADYKGALPHSHTKLLIVDGKTAVAAGYNMTYEHYSLLHPSRNGGGRNDLGIQVTGPVVQDSVVAFDELWVDSDERTCTDFNPIYGVWQATCFDFKATGQHVPEVMKYYIPETAEATAFSMFRNNVRDESDWQIANALSAAESSIDTMQVNFTLELVCDLNILYDVCNFNEALPYMEGLLQGAENGAAVRILVKGAPVDGIETGVAIAVLEDEIKKRGLEDKIEIRYFDGPMHYKSINIDDELVIVGSQNFHYSAMNPLSGLAEYNLGVVDEDAVQQYKSLFEYHWARGSLKDAKVE